MVKTFRQETREKRLKEWEENKITLEEHKEFGEMCKVMHDKLMKAWSCKYSTAKEMDKCKERKCARLLENLKCYMEEAMFGDYPFDEEATTNVYYGTNKWRESKRGKK